MVDYRIDDKGGKKGSGFFSDLGGVLFSPFQTLESLYQRRANYLAIILFVGITTAAINYYTFTRPNLLYLKALDLIMFDRYTNSESTTSLVEAVSKVKGRLILGFLTTSLAIGGRILILGILVSTCVRFLGGRTNIDGTIRLLSYAALIPFLGFLVGLLFLFYRGFDLVADLADLKMGISLNLFAPYSRSRISEIAHLFLRRFDLFAIWYLILAGKGVALANRISLIKAFIIIGVLYYLGVWVEFAWERYGWLILKVLF